MVRWLLLLFVLVVTAGLPVAVAAQDPNLAQREQEFAAAVNDPIMIAPNERVAVVLSIHNEATIDGTVSDLLIIIDGNVTINGVVENDVVAFSSHVILGPNAVVNHITLQSSTLDQQPGSQVNGNIEIQGRFFLLEWWSSPVFALIMWVLITFFLVTGGIIFTLASGQQFPTFVSATSRHIGQNILRALMIWIGVPILAVLIMVTIIGIPLGLVLLMLVLPGLWWLGYSVAGARIGSLLLRPFGTRYSTAKAVASTILGILALQLLILVPYIGGTVIFFVGAYGSGALIYHLMRGRHDQLIDPELADFGPEFSRASADLRFRE